MSYNAGGIDITLDARLNALEANLRRGGVVVRQTTQQMADDAKKADRAISGIGSGGGDVRANARAEASAAFASMRSEARASLDVAEAERRQAAQAIASGAGGYGGGRGGSGGGLFGGGAFGALGAAASLTAAVTGLGLLLQKIDQITKASQSARSEANAFSSSLYLQNPRERAGSFDSRISAVQSRIQELAEQKAYYGAQFGKVGDDPFFDNPIKAYYRIRYLAAQERESNNIKLLNELERQRGLEPGAQVEARARRLESFRYGLERTRGAMNSQLTDNYLYDQTFRINEAPIIGREINRQTRILRTIATNNALPSTVNP